VFGALPGPGLAAESVNLQQLETSKFPQPECNLFIKSPRLGLFADMTNPAGQRGSAARLKSADQRDPEDRAVLPEKILVRRMRIKTVEQLTRLDRCGLWNDIFGYRLF
jgi:hypothetical protein